MKRTPTRGALPQQFLTGLLALCTALSLAACGGGGGGGGGGGSSPSPGSGGNTPPPAPTPSATLTASASSVAVGQPVTLTWSSQNTGATNCQASGNWSGSLAASGTQVVTTTANATATPYTASYGITCGTASGNVAVSVAPPVHSVQMTVDAGTDGNAINAPFVSVTVCQPGTSSCQTIDHILVDTGSFGLRLIKSADSALGTLALQTVQSSSGAAIGECGQFLSGYTWGSVVKADVKLGDEVASNLSIQLIGDTPGGASTPSDCSAIGNDLGSVKALGAKGVLGIGLFKQDCGTNCDVTAPTAPSAAYYACTNGSCTSTTMPLAQQVTNPVAAFPIDNNGVSLSFSPVGTGGVNTLAGTLAFGIGTRADNGLGSAKKYPATADKGYITTVYNGVTMSNSFLDSGSNGLFFNDDKIAHCSQSTDFYCPASPLSRSATITAGDGSVTTIPFTVESVDALPDAAVAGWIGGPGGAESKSNGFDWGLPFFFGRTVYIGLESDTGAKYWAF